MFYAKIRILLFVSGLLIISLPFTGSDCNSSNNPPAPSGGVAAPQNVSVIINSDSTGQQSSAVIGWDASPDESMNNFSGYKVVTYKLDDNNNIISTFQSENFPSAVHSHTIDSIGTGTRFHTYVTAVLNDGTESDSAGTLIYAGVFYRTDGTIDEYQPGDTSFIESGYGWNIQTGRGTNYLFNSSNTGMIDILLRGGINDSLTFYSPNLFAPGTKSTKFLTIGPGQEAFDLTQLSEPDMDSVRVDSDYVYLVKTQEGYYVKLWVRAIYYIAGSIPPYHNVVFDYKVQPVADLRVL